MRPGIHSRTGNDRLATVAMGALVWIMVLSVCLPDGYTYAGPVSTDDNPLRHGLWLTLLAISGTVVLLKMALARRVIRELNVYYVLWLGLALASVVWSVDQELTGRKLVRLSMMCMAFLAVTLVSWQPRTFQRLVRPPLTFIVVASIVFALGWPDLALHHESNAELANAWHGVCLTKNQLGAVASFAFILWVHAWMTKETGRLRALLGAGGALLCLIESRSQTSLISSVLATFAILLMLRRSSLKRRHARIIVTILAIAIGVFSLAMLRVIPGLDIILEPIPLLTGKDLTFSNRVAIWAVVVDHIRLRPLFGSGYGAFWVTRPPTPDLDSYFVIVRLNGFYPGSSHNGYLQVLNDLGAVGLFFLIGYMWVFFRQSIRLYSVDLAQGSLYVGLLLQQATINMEEPNWLNSIIVDFVPMSLATTCLARALLEAKSRVQIPSRGASRSVWRSVLRPRGPGPPGPRAHLPDSGRSSRFDPRH